MNVADLIKKLEKLDPDAVVFVQKKAFDGADISNLLHAEYAKYIHPDYTKSVIIF